MRKYQIVFVSACLIALAASVIYADVRFLPESIGNAIMYRPFAMAGLIVSLTFYLLVATVATSRLLMMFLKRARYTKNDPNILE